MRKLAEMITHHVLENIWIFLLILEERQMVGILTLIYWKSRVSSNAMKANEIFTHFINYCPVLGKVQNNHANVTFLNYVFFRSNANGLESLESEQQLSALSLKRDVSAYRYTRPDGSQSSQVDGLDDRKLFKDVEQAMKSVGFENEEVNSIWSLMAAILHLGNVDFTPDGDTATISNKGPG